MTDGHRYLLRTGDRNAAHFRATGLDQACRIARIVNAAIEKALADDPGVLAVERPIILVADVPRCTSDRDCLANLHNRGCPKR